jgi:hypothetical protein
MSLHRLTIFTLFLGLSLPLTISLSSMELSSNTTPPATSLPLPPSPLLISDQTLNDSRIELMGVLPEEALQTATSPEEEVQTYERIIGEIIKLKDQIEDCKKKGWDYAKLEKLYEQKEAQSERILHALSNEALKIIDTLGNNIKGFVAPELPILDKQIRNDIDQYHEILNEVVQLKKEFGAMKDPTSRNFLHTIKLYEEKIAEANAMMLLMNPKREEAKMPPYIRYPSLCDQGYVFDWQRNNIVFPNGLTIQYHLIGPATVTNGNSSYALIAGLISGVVSFTALVTENLFLTGAAVVGSAALHRYGWTPYKQGKSPRDKITADYKALLNILPYFKQPAPNNQSVSPPATTPLLPGAPQSHPQSPTDVSVPCVTVVEAKPAQNLNAKDPKAEIFEEVDAAPGE